MAITSRSLRIESCEDRVVPAVLTFIPVGSIQQAYGATYSLHDRVALGDREGSAFQSEAHGGYFGGTLFVVQSNSDFPVIVRVVNWGGNWNTIIELTPVSTPAPTPQPTTNGNPNTTPDGTGPSSNGTARPVNHGSTDAGNDSSTGRTTSSSTSSVSVSINSSGAAATESRSDGATAADSAARQVASNAPPIVVDSRPEFGHLTMPIAAEIDPTVAAAGADSVVPQSDEPPVAPVEPEVAIAPTPAGMSTPSAPAAATANPLSGVFPFNLRTIESGVRGVLDHVANLEQLLPESSANTEDYLWMAAAALVAGGAAQSAWTRRSRPTDPRTLGLDSVLARWGEKYVG